MWAKDPRLFDMAVFTVRERYKYARKIQDLPEI